MFHLLFRIVGLFLLAFALVLAVLDITRSITASAIVLTPLIDTWTAISPQSLEASRNAVSAWVHPILWDPVLLFLLKLPSWLIIWLIAMVLLWLGRKSEDPYRRFASR